MRPTAYVFFALTLASCASSASTSTLSDRSLSGNSRAESLREKIEAKLESGNIADTASTLRMMADLQVACIGKPANVQATCNTDGLFAKYNAQRIALAEKDSDCAPHVEKIKARKIVIGSSYKCALLAKGAPGKINTTRISNGSSEQWVYGTGSYVYIKNGIVEAEQNSR